MEILVILSILAVIYVLMKIFETEMGRMGHYIRLTPLTLVGFLYFAIKRRAKEFWEEKVFSVLSMQIGMIFEQFLKSRIGG